MQRQESQGGQVCRGCGSSDGEFNPFRQEAHDGYDTITWIAAQNWAKGAVGVAGSSYLGAVQWLVPSEGPVSLQALAPSITTAQYYHPWTYQGGAFQLGFCLFWTLGYFAIPELQRRVAHRQAKLIDLSTAVHALADIENLYWQRPLTNLPEFRQVIPFYFDWLAHPSFDEYWQAITLGTGPHLIDRD